MDFRTITEIPKSLPQIDYSDELLLLGSCFAENIGKLMVENKFRCDINPLGILYNPLSVSEALRQIVEGRAYTEADLFYSEGQYHSYMHHSSFSASRAEDALEKINSRMQQAHERIGSLHYLFITLGTSWVYTLHEDGRVVSNCHKLPANVFTRRRLGVAEIVAGYTRLLEQMFDVNGRLKVVLTVSPVRHVKDGLHGNQLSKAALFLAVDELCTLFPGKLFYFPSYEIVNDELRDYRFYADDMLHPSSLAVQYVWQRLTDALFSEETRTILEEWQSIRRAIAHKPFHPQSQQHKSFLEQIVLKIEHLKEKYPYLDVQNELEICHTLLK